MFQKDNLRDYWKTIVKIRRMTARIHPIQAPRFIHMELNISLNSSWWYNNIEKHSAHDATPFNENILRSLLTELKLLIAYHLETN